MYTFLIQITHMSVPAPEVPGQPNLQFPHLSVSRFDLTAVAHQGVFGGFALTVVQ